MKLSQLAILSTVAAVTAHRHVHRHASKHAGSPIEGRAPDVVTTWVSGPTETIYELNGQELDAAQVSSGLVAGIYVLVPETPTPTPIASSTTAVAAEFFQEPSTTAAPPSTTTEAPPTSSNPPPPASTPAPAPSPSAPSSGTSGGSGINSEFPSGTIPCSQFPSAYGPIAASWLMFNGFTGIQGAPSYNPGDSSIGYLTTVPEAQGGSCTPNSFCSYMCPEGYQKSQWPSAQGSTGQSIGGLYCNGNGMLELSRPQVPQLCIQGTGQVKVKNTLGSDIAICRTDYPGTESETVALDVTTGGTHDLTCPDASNYYWHQGSPTSAQYYINPLGVSASVGCQWQTANTAGNWHGSPGNIGNWAPVNLGVGKGTDGLTFISLIPNIPTNPDGTLGFNIAITGDVSGSCEYKNGQFYNNNVVDPTGCTVQVNGIATYVLS